MPIYDFILIGIDYKLLNNNKLFFETGYNKLSLIRIGLKTGF